LTFITGDQNRRYLARQMLAIKTCWQFVDNHWQLPAPENHQQLLAITFAMMSSQIKLPRVSLALKNFS